MARSKTICILYGVNEGPAIGRKFRQACKRSGLKVIRNAKQADIIFAHSGGALLIPEKNRAKLTLLVGLAYWPDQPWLIGTKRHLYLDWLVYKQRRAYLGLVLKWFFWGVYFWRLDRTIRMGLKQNLAAPWNSRKPQVIVRNRYDAYLTPEVHALPFNGPRTFIAFPDGHDDCWHNPQRYVDLIQSVYGTGE